MKDMMETTVKTELCFENKFIMAPMVRIGTLPMRLLALSCGADIVYSEELIDYRLLKCKRIENSILVTVDYIDEDQNIVFRTCEKEKDRLVLQIGTCNAERALQVALKVQQDVSGIDINMGCPKEFSIKGGMGAALLSQPEKAEEILKTLVSSLKRPVTCKIRLLPTIDETLKFVKIIGETGVAAVAVHGRTRQERPQHSNRNDEIKIIADTLHIPVIANGGSGEISCYEDLSKFRERTGASSVMIARQAEKNCSIFSKDGKRPLDDMIKEYLKLSIEYDNHFSNTKYCIQQMLGSLQESERGQKLLAAQQMEEICVLWGMLDVFKLKQEEMSVLASQLQLNKTWEESLKKRKTSQGETWIMEARFIKTLFNIGDLPKTTLINWTRKNKIKQPLYKTVPVEKSFSSVVTVCSQNYTSSFLEKNKKQAEQAAALVALYALGLVDSSKIKGTSVGKPTHSDYKK